MSFLKRKKQGQDAPPPPTPVQEEVTAQEYLLRLAYIARTAGSGCMRRPSLDLAR